jgi:Tfp pilus assembly protein PilO
MNISTKHVNRTCFIIVITVSLICGYLSIGHVIKKRQQFDVEKDVLSKKMSEVDLAASNLGELKAVLAETKKELHYLNERIPESGKIGLLLKQIDALMKQRQLALISLKPLPVREEKIYFKNPIQLVFKGNFIDIHHLIHDLERMNRILVMEKMTISKQKNVDQCRVEFLVNVFEQKKGI